ncbi:unnamed protein product, partial [Rotaria sp. Silwood1]
TTIPKFPKTRKTHVVNELSPKNPVKPDNKAQSGAQLIRLAHIRSS